jgi:tight adherence protein B
MEMMPLLLVILGAAIVLGMIAFAFAGPSAGRAQSRRIASLRERHGDALVVAEAQLRRISMNRDTKMDLAFGRILPNPVQLAKRLAMTGKTWTVGQYGMATAGILVVVAALMLLKGLPILLALLFGVFVGVGLPHFIVGKTIQRRIGKFTAKFPDAIDLLVRGLRSGLPISETIGVVGHAALQETADRLGTPEFQFFVITIAIQRETGGNLAETLANLSHVLRMRGQMKLKIKAMSSESKASAYIIGALPFIVFGLIWFINGTYMQNFFIDERLMAIGMGGMVWMAIGAFIMSKMISFEI